MLHVFKSKTHSFCTFSLVLWKSLFTSLLYYNILRFFSLRKEPFPCVYCVWIIIIRNKFIFWSLVVQQFGFMVVMNIRNIKNTSSLNCGIFLFLFLPTLKQNKRNPLNPKENQAKCDSLFCCLMFYLLLGKLCLLLKSTYYSLYVEDNCSHCLKPKIRLNAVEERLGSSSP